MGYKLVVTEKPSVARAYADALGVKNAQDEIGRASCRERG